MLTSMMTNGAVCKFILMPITTTTSSGTLQAHTSATRTHQQKVNCLNSRKKGQQGVKEDNHISHIADWQLCRLYLNASKWTLLQQIGQPLKGPPRLGQHSLINKENLLKAIGAIDWSARNLSVSHGLSRCSLRSSSSSSLVLTITSFLGLFRCLPLPDHNPELRICQDVLDINF